MRAREMMTEPLVWASVQDTIHEVSALLKKKGISGVPVRDRLGRAVGVLSKTDLAYYDLKRFERLLQDPAGRALAKSASEQVGQAGFDLRPRVEMIESWITPRIYTVPREASLETVIKQMLKHDVHRVFVRSKASGDLIGIITLTDILKNLVAALRHARKPREGKGERP